MVCDIVSAKETFEYSIKRAEFLSKTMKITKEGEVLSETLASAKKALELLNGRDYPGLSELGKTEFANDLATATARRQLGGVFKAAIGKNPTEKSKRKEYVLKSAKYKTDVPRYGDVVEIVATLKGSNNPLTYEFPIGPNSSIPSKKTGSRMYIPYMGITTDRVMGMVTGTDASLTRVEKADSANKGIAEMNASLKANDNVADLLSSSTKYDKNPFDYKRASYKQDYIHGSKEGMKNMLADLHALGGKPTTSELYRYYDELLDSMHDNYFKEMSLYINENEDDNQGWVEVDKKHILLNTTKGLDVGMSNAEVYMHEVIHTMTTWALKGDSDQTVKLRNRLNYLRGQAFKNITWQDLQKTDKRISANGAKERFNHIFGGKSSNDEFLAFALTNPGFMALLEKVKLKDERETGFFGAIKNLFSSLMDAFMGNNKFSNRNNSVQKEVHTLAFMLARINKNGEDVLKNSPNPLVLVSDYVSNVIDKLEGGYEEYVTKAANYIFDTKGELVVPPNMGHVQKVLFYAKFFGKAIYNSDYRHGAGIFFTNHGLGARSSFREITRSVLPGVHEHITMEVEQLGLKASTIDRSRNLRVAHTSDSIIKGFNKTPTDQEQENLTSILMEANGSTLFTNDKNNGKGYSKAKLVQLLNDTGYRKRVIHSLKRRIKNKNNARSNWVIGQAEGLGIFMATGKGHEAQNSNSDNIVRGYLTSERFKVDEQLLSMVEELASLTAISHQGSDKSASVASLLTSEEKGVRNLVNLYEAFKANSKNSLFKGDNSHIMEGYIKELYADDIEVTYAVLSRQEELEKAGFVLQSIIEANDLSGAEAVGFFVSGTNTRPERLSGAINLGNPNSRGMTLKEARYIQFHDSKKHAQVWFEADRAKYNAKAIEINKQLEAGVPVSDIEQGPVPVLDATGNAVDYRNMMSKRDKAKYFKQNLKVIDVLSKTAGGIVDKIAREDQNKEVLAMISKNLREVYDVNSKDNLLEYTFVGPDHKDPEIAKLFHQMPKEFQQFALRREDKVLPIPTMLMDLYFGYSQGRMTDFPGIEKLPGTIKRIINMFEKVWIDLVKIVKGNILLKMPYVLYVNIVSNIIYAINTGVGITEIFGAYKKSITDVGKFMKNHKEKEAKDVELLALTQHYFTTKLAGADLDSYNDEVDRLKMEIKRLEQEMEESEIKELFDLGMYQAVIEDVNMYKMGDTNKISDTADKYLNKLPTVIKTPIQWLYLSKETKWYELNQHVLQMSDLVARDVMNKKMKIIEKRMVAGTTELPIAYRKLTGNVNRKKAVGGMSKGEEKEFLALSEKVRHAHILKAFVNYNLPNGKGEEFLNRYGILMFTKYMKRIQMVVADASLRHPIRSTGMLLAAGGALELEMIQDSAWLVKAGDDYGLWGLTPLYSPGDIIEMAATPPLINLANKALGY